MYRNNNLDKMKKRNERYYSENKEKIIKKI